MTVIRRFSLKRPVEIRTHCAIAGQPRERRHPPGRLPATRVQELDGDVVAVSPSSVYRVLREAGLMKRHNSKPSLKETGFQQPR